MLERYFIEHCSPTLASLKTASLFTYICDSDCELIRQVQAWNYSFQAKGLSLVVLRRRQGRALLYVYRKSSLHHDLCSPGVARFLSSYGYGDIHNMDAALERLKNRLSDSEVFPHEIGVFLGYPLGDVIGFIQNAGQNCKCTGCWKVYCNECEAVRLFAKYQKCRDVYLRLWNQGRSVLQLTVAA